MANDKPGPPLVGEMMAEFLGTVVLIALGVGVVAMVVLFRPNVDHGGYTNITLGWGLAVLMGVCIAGRVSGGHLNPAVTLALAVFRGFPWRKVIPFMAAQLAGAFVGAALVYLNYYPAFEAFDPLLEKQATVTVFATEPAFNEHWSHYAYAFFDQVLGTSLLVSLVFAISEPKNPFMLRGLQPLLVALVVVAIGISWGGMHGYAINPARDLGPRLFILAAGHENAGFADGTFLTPIFGPLLGGLLGAFLYEWMIRPYMPAVEEEAK